MQRFIYKRMKEFIYKQIKKIALNTAPNVVPSIENGNNKIQNITLQLEDGVIVLPASCSISGNLNLIEKRLIFTDVSSGVYELAVHHKNETWKSNRKKVWACIRLHETENTELTANRMGVNFSSQYGCFKYCGGGYLFRDGVYCSSTGEINIYEDVKNIVIELKTGNDYDILNDIFSVGFIKKQKIQIESLDEKSNNNSINVGNLLNICNTNNKDTYVVYASISQNVVDGSSVWLSAITDVIAANYKVILLLKENTRNNLIISNIKNRDNVIFLQPSDYLNNKELINEDEAISIIKQIDNICANVRGVLVRGSIAADRLTNDRSFKYRTICYLTDFYSVENNEIVIKDSSMLNKSVLHSTLLLTQTQQIADKIFSSTGYIHDNYLLFPPIMPDTLFNLNRKQKIEEKENEITIGYAGKVMPNWGVEELLEWVTEFNRQSVKKKIKVHLVAQKISAPGEYRKPFVSRILNLIQKSGAVHYTNYNREQSTDLLSKMDYVWAFRPAIFEENTLELSTKLLESIAIKQQVFCYPSEIHRQALGKDYPLFIRSKEDFFSVLNNDNAMKNFSMDILADKLQKTNSASNVAINILNYEPFKLKEKKFTKTILFAGHDMKFIAPYVSYLKSQGINALQDMWEWGECIDLSITKKLYERSDVIFCEWGLANAVYYSKNNYLNKPIFIRVHAQEIRERAQKFGRQINFNNVTKVIFVSQKVCDEYIKLFNIPVAKTVVIPNFVLDDEFTISKNLKGDESKVVLGMVGIVPQLKRFDRAIEILENLLKDGVNAELHIKGHRPENMEMMKAPSRAKEMQYYNKIYTDISQKGLSDRVVFDAWGNDVALWYRDVDFILSLSDTESFHYALADGVLSGCIPVIWNWNEAEKIYKTEWIVSSVEQAVDSVKHNLTHKYNIDQILNANRKFIIGKYGHKKIFHLLNKTIFE